MSNLDDAGRIEVHAHHLTASVDAVVTNNCERALLVRPNSTTGTYYPTLHVDTSAVNAATGIYIQAEAAGGGVNVSATSSAPNEALRIDALGTGSIDIATRSTGTVYIGANTIITAQNVDALAVGRQGATLPAFHVDSSAAASATGLAVTAAAAAAGVALATTSSAGSEAMTIDAKGTGTLSLQSHGGTGTLYVGTNEIITSRNANALAVGRQGATLPAFNVDSSAAGSTTGLTVTASTTGSGVALTSNASESFTVAAGGSGTLLLQPTTADVVLGGSGGRIGFYGGGPVTKPAAVATPVINNVSISVGYNIDTSYSVGGVNDINDNFSNIANAVNGIIARLHTLGLTA